MKKAILSVSFGTTHRDALEKTVAALEDDCRAAFPEYEVRRAFTSGMVIKKLKEGGTETDTVSEALERLAADGFGKIICLATHIINGFEYDKLTDTAAAFSDRAEISVTRPLVSLSEDYADIIHALAPHLPSDRLCVLMGHGTEHFANSVYPALRYRLRAEGFKNVYVGTVEGYPSLTDVLAEIDAPYRDAVLMPFMFTAGDHAKNDMAVEWQSALRRAGYRTECVIKGLGEYKAVRDLYIRRIREI